MAKNEEYTEKQTFVITDNEMNDAMTMFLESKGFKVIDGKINLIKLQGKQEGNWSVVFNKKNLTQILDNSLESEKTIRSNLKNI